MTGLRALWSRVTSPFSRSRRDRELAAEIESHLQLAIDDNLRQGMEPAEARRQAALQFGSVPAAVERHRELRGVAWLDALVRDIRFAVRMLGRAPGFTATAIVILTVGIGANGAAFSMVNAMLLRPLNGGSLETPVFGLYSGSEAQPDTFRSFSYPEYVEIRDRNQVFTSLFAEALAQPALTEGGITRRVFAGLVSANYFETLGARPSPGRPFTEAEDVPGRGADVTIVSHAYWRRHGLAPDIVGRTLVLNGRTFTIVGVAPEGFSGTFPVSMAELWLPLSAADVVAESILGSQNGITTDRASQSLLLAGPLRAGLSMAAADAQLSVLAASLAAAYPRFNRDQRLTVYPRSRFNLGPMPRDDAEAAAAFLVLMSLAGLVLLVACLNLANLQLARGSARQREVAVRLALGGSRFQVIRQFFLEGLLLSLLAGAVALFVAWGFMTWLLASVAAVVDMPLELAATPDGRVIGTVLVTSVISALLFALVPAVRLSRVSLMGAMKVTPLADGGRRRWAALPNTLVGGQLAISLALVAAAGAFVRASVNAAGSDPGFTLEDGLLAEIGPGLAGLDPSEGRAIYADALARVRALPAVEAASLGSIVPFGMVQESRIVRGPVTTTRATFTIAGADYFAALGLPVIAGREFTTREEQDALDAPVAIIDVTLADALFPGRSAIGEFITLSERDDEAGDRARIVGLVRSVRDDILRGEEAHVYVPLGSHYREQMTLHVRAGAASPQSVLESVRLTIRDVDPRLPVLSLQTLEDYRDASSSLWVVRFGARLFGAFGLIALVLVSVGVYGLRAYLVSVRTRELGIRMALGASRRRLVAELVREGGRVAAASALVGLGLAFGVVRLLQQSGLLYQVGAFDPVVCGFVVLVLSAVVAAASYAPARRVAAVDPVMSLRSG